MLTTFVFDLLPSVPYSFHTYFFPLYISFLAIFTVFFNPSLFPFILLGNFFHLFFWCVHTNVTSCNSLPHTFLHEILCPLSTNGSSFTELIPKYTRKKLCDSSRYFGRPLTCLKYYTIRRISIIGDYTNQIQYCMYLIEKNQCFFSQ